MLICAFYDLLKHQPVLLPGVRRRRIFNLTDKYNIWENTEHVVATLSLHPRIAKPVALVGCAHDGLD